MIKIKIILLISTNFFVLSLSAAEDALPYQTDKKLTFYFEPSADGKTARLSLYNSTGTVLTAEFLAARAYKEASDKKAAKAVLLNPGVAPQGKLVFPIRVGIAERIVIDRSISANDSSYFSIKKLVGGLLYVCVVYKSLVYGWNTKGWVASCYDRSELDLQRNQSFL